MEFVRDLIISYIVSLITAEFSTYQYINKCLGSKSSVTVISLPPLPLNVVDNRSLITGKGVTASAPGFL